MANKVNGMKYEFFSKMIKKLIVRVFSNGEEDLYDMGTIKLYSLRQQPKEERTFDLNLTIVTLFIKH